MNSDPSASGVPAGLDPAKIPRHVAVIMDGNGRWAKQRMMNRIRGHEKGAETVRTIVETSREVGIGALTLYAFSTENWRRPRAEIAALMTLLKRFLQSEKETMLKNDIRLNVVGQPRRLPADVREALDGTMTATAANKSMTLNLALSYGGRTEITEAVQAIARKAADGAVNPDDITADTVADHLYTAGMPDPDLLIRTSGEMRISNFLLWQIAYAELFITDTLWPDFGRDEFIDILRDYQRRDRRFGKVN